MPDAMSRPSSTERPSSVSLSKCVFCSRCHLLRTASAVRLGSSSAIRCHCVPMRRTAARMVRSSVFVHPTFRRLRAFAASSSSSSSSSGSSPSSGWQELIAGSTLLTDCRCLLPVSGGLGSAERRNGSDAPGHECDAPRDAPGFLGSSAAVASSTSGFEDSLAKYGLSHSNSPSLIERLDDERRSTRRGCGMERHTHKGETALEPS